MRIWSIHPSYLDAKGLVACWRETLLAQSCLMKGEFEPHLQTPHTRLRRTPYYNHPQLERFKKCKYPIQHIGWYLFNIYEEAYLRGYDFNKKKIVDFDYTGLNYLTVTKGQLEYEFLHLQKKLMVRCPSKYLLNAEENLSKDIEIKPNPIFQVIDGQIESWEKINA